MRKGMIRVAVATLLVSCAMPPCTDRAPADLGNRAKPCTGRFEKSDFMVLSWHGESKSVDASRSLLDYPPEDLRAHDCEPGCMEAIAGRLSSVAGECSRSCLESVFPGPWMAYWKSVLPETTRARMKPVGYGLSREMEFFRDSVVVIRDSVITVCAPEDTTADWWQYQPLYYHRNRYSWRERIVFRKWKVVFGAVLLARGTRTITRQTPYREPGRESEATDAVPDRRARIRAPVDSVGDRWGRPRWIELEMEGESWSGLSNHLLAEEPNAIPRRDSR